MLSQDSSIPSCPILVPGRSELAVLSATAMLTGTVRQIRAPPLLHRLVLFLLGPDQHPETLGNAPHPLRTQLIDRCNHLSDEVSPVFWGTHTRAQRGDAGGTVVVSPLHLAVLWQISLASLRLFEELLQKPHEHVARSLALRNLETRGYLQRGPPAPEEHGPPEADPDEDGL